MPMTSVCPGCAHEEACGHADVHACAMRDPVEIARLSASAGTTAEEARANVSATAVRLSADAEPPSPWCSCDPLRRAEAERDEARQEARSNRRLHERARMSLSRHRIARRKAEAERDRYRALSLRLTCCNQRRLHDCDIGCYFDTGEYCAAVIEEVDGR